MAINKDSNTYTIGFAIILVVLVGGLLAMIANGLKPIQDENLVNEKKQNILNCLPGNKLISRDEAGSLFSEFVKQRLILDYNGEVKENTLLDNSIELNKFSSKRYKVPYLFPSVKNNLKFFTFVVDSRMSI